MIAYYGTKISPNQIETGEGFLICKNVPIARVGDMEYMASEIGLKGDGVITVHRSPEDVFSPAALASFEGKPVTNDHPPELVTPDTVTMYEKGHAQNVRKGAGEWEGYVIADLHIHDAELIRQIKDGKREVSCGYECEYVDNGDGTFSQKKIIGNHIAVVDRGRAGKRAAIMDSNTNTAAKPLERTPTKMSRNSVLFRLFGQAANGKTVEEIDRLALDTAAVMDEETAQPTDEEKPAEAPAEAAEAQDEAEKPAPFDADALAAKIADAILAKLQPAEEKPEEKDPIDAAIEALTEVKEGAKDEDTEEAVTVPAEEMDEETDPAMDKAAAVAILKAMRPAIAGIENEAQRKAVSDSLIGLVSGKDSDAAKIIKAAKRNAQAAADKRPQCDIDAIQALYNAANPHIK
jgi:hypothetical protein